MRTASIAAGWLLGALLATNAAAEQPPLRGRVVDAAGEPVVGAMLSLARGDPAHRVTVFADADGAFRAPLPDAAGAATLRVRRFGFRDLHVDAPDAASVATLQLERETDPAALAAQLPANHWFALVLARVGDEAKREELVRQCAYCHQQGNAATRRVRDADDWNRVLTLMGRMGGIVSSELRAEIPTLFDAAYDPATAVPALTTRMQDADFAPPPSAEVRRARIDEWELGGTASMQHDIVVHPDGRIYSVDMTQDQLYRLDPSAADGARAAWSIPTGDLPLGGAMAATDQKQPPGLERARRPAFDPGRARQRAVDHARARQSARALRSRHRSVDDARARERLLPAHAALRCARPDLVHDRGVEPSRLLRSQDWREPRSCACRRRVSRRISCCARCRRSCGSVATSTSAASPPKAAIR